MPGKWWSIVSWLRRPRRTAGGSRGRRTLESLKDEAATAPPSSRPSYCLRAARTASSMGLRSEALSLYGEAIDGYLETGRGRAAEVVCREIIEAYPEVVRARRTLALVALGRGEGERAAELVHDYAESAKRSGDPELTKSSLRAMGLICGSGPARSRTAQELRALGDATGVRMLMEEDRAAGSDPAHDDSPAGAWSRALQAALLGADDLRGFRAVES